MLTKLRSKAGKSKPAVNQPSSKDGLKPPVSSVSTPASPAKALTARKVPADVGQPSGPRHGRASVPVGAASPQLRTKEAAVSQLREMLVNGGCPSTVNGSRLSGAAYPTLGRSTSQPKDDAYELFNASDVILQSPIASICHRPGCSSQPQQPTDAEPPPDTICSLHPHHHHHHHSHPPHPCSSSPQQPPHPCSSSPQHPAAIDFQTRIRSAYRRSFIQGCSRTRLQQQLASSEAGYGGGSIPSIPLHLPPPLHSLLSRSADRSLGQAFLVYRGETKRCRLPNQVTSLDTVRAMFVRAFPAKLTMTSFTDSSDLTIYTLDPTVNVFYELDDVREIGDLSVLKIIDRGQSGLVPLPVTVQSSRIHQSAVDILLLPPQPVQQHQPQSPKMTGDRLSIYSNPNKWSISSSSHRPIYDGQWPYSAEPSYSSRAPNSPRLFDVDSPADHQAFDHWSTSDGMVICPRWSSGYICCPSSDDDKRMTISDGGQSGLKTQPGLISQYHHHHLNHSVAYLPSASIGCCDAVDSHHHPQHQQPTEAGSISTVQAPSCSWTEVLQTGRTSPTGSEVTTELDYDSRRRMEEVETRLVTLTTWLQNNLQLTTNAQPEVNGRTTNDDVTSVQCPEVATNSLPVDGPGRKDRRVEREEMQRTISLINRKMNGLKEEWRKLRDENLERTRDVQDALQDIRLTINNVQPFTRSGPLLVPPSQVTFGHVGQATNTEPTSGSSRHENGNDCHVTEDRAVDAGRSLESAKRSHKPKDPHSPHKSKDQNSPHKSKDQHSPHRSRDMHSPHKTKNPNSPHKSKDQHGSQAQKDRSGPTPDTRAPLQTEDPLAPQDAIPPPAPSAPQPPDSPIWRRAEPAPQTPTVKPTEPHSSQRSSSMTTGHPEWTSDPNDNQNARNPNGSRVRRNEEETGPQSTGRPSPGRHHSSGGQWQTETGQNPREMSVDDWPPPGAVRYPAVNGRYQHAGGHQWYQETTGVETPSKERSVVDFPDVFRSPGFVYGRVVGPPPPPPPRRLSHSFVRDTARAFDGSQPQPMGAASARQQLVASRRVSMPGELRRPHSSSPARSAVARLSSFLGHAPTDEGGTDGQEYHGRPSGTGQLNLIRSPTRLSRYTQDLATGIYSTLNRPDLQDQWLNVTDVETMRNALALQREIAAKEGSTVAAQQGPVHTVGTRSGVTRSTSSSSDSSSSDEDSSSASGDSQTTILRAPKQSLDERKQ